MRIKFKGTFDLSTWLFDDEKFSHRKILDRKIHVQDIDKEIEKEFNKMKTKLLKEASLAVSNDLARDDEGPWAHIGCDPKDKDKALKISIYLELDGTQDPYAKFRLEDLLNHHIDFYESKEEMEEIYKKLEGILERLKTRIDQME